MEHHVVIGTAGHIDHGKTTLVKALTGVDTDRLAEEKARGITIDLGFAPLTLTTTEGDHEGRPNRTVVHASIVDVPGHEGFIRNMVAGATGVDLALLVVAADEGIMPQTREHFTILHHLGVHRGVVALTKSDLAPDPAWQAMVSEEIRELTRPSGTAWPIFPVSAASGDGLDALRAGLAAAAAGIPARPAEDHFRMPVDRVFAIAGAGTIVTGTVWSGGVQEGESVTVLPLDRAARVRSIQVHSESSPRTGSGRRAALALVGIARDEAGRGSVIVTGDGWRASRAIDVAVTTAPGVALKLRSRVRVHHGTAEVMGRVARFGGPGDGGTGGPAERVMAVRLRLDEPIVARAGDRLVLRSFSPVTTIGGGVITDPWAERMAGQRRRQGPPVGPEGTPAEAVARLIVSRGGAGMSHAEITVASGLDVARLTAALAKIGKLGVVECDGWFVAAAEVDAAVVRMKEALEAFHAAQPLEPGMSIQAWRGSAKAEREGLAELAIAVLESKNTVKRDGALVRRSTWNPSATADATATQDRVLGILKEAGGEPPSAAEVAATLPGVDVPGVLRMLVRAGRIVPVSDRYYAREALDFERERLAVILQELGPATPAAIRERMGRSRKWLIPLLEWADREGLTVRTGDLRALRNTPPA